jgi:hypothetical protein
VLKRGRRRRSSTASTANSSRSLRLATAPRRKSSRAHGRWRGSFAPGVHRQTAPTRTSDFRLGLPPSDSDFGPPTSDFGHRAAPLPRCDRNESRARSTQVLARSRCQSPHVPLPLRRTRSRSPSPRAGGACCACTRRARPASARGCGARNPLRRFAGRGRRRTGRRSSADASLPPRRAALRAGFGNASPSRGMDDVRLEMNPPPLSAGEA